MKDRFKLSEPSGYQRFMFQEYWVDFLGGLVPGALFSVAILYILFPSFVLLINILNNISKIGVLDIITKIIKATEGTPNMIWIGISILLITLSYILGHIFYRQDPKIPNQESFSKLIEKLSKKVGRKCSKRRLRLEFGCTSIDDCEFPYPYFNQYLGYRGLKHLIPLAVWCQRKQHRTKNYINILKVRLRFYFPNHCSTIIRNEAHVRLATSVWYVGKVVIKLSIFSFVILLFSVLISLFKGTIQFDTLDLFGISISPFLINLFTIVSGGYFGYYFQSHVEDFLHYQRQREIVHVLEIAATSSLERPEILNAPFNRNNNK